MSAVNDFKTPSLSGDDKKNAEMGTGARSSSVHDVAIRDNEEVVVARQFFSKTAMLIIFSALGLLASVLWLDNAITYAYLNYAASQFNSFSMLGAISTASTIINAVSQPPVAKLSDVIGRGLTFGVCLVGQTVALVLMAASKSLTTYAIGFSIYTFSLTGMTFLSQVIISDFTSARKRSLGIALFYIPSVVTPFAGSFILDAVIKGVGWRWGLAMFAIMYPCCGIWLVLSLSFFERRAQKNNRVKVDMPFHSKVYNFASHIDLGGNILVCGAFGLFLIPISLAGSGLASWSTPYIIALLVIGPCLLVFFISYEHWVARFPVVPLRYFRNRTIVLVLGCAALDYFALYCTHAYLFSWATVARDLSPRDANFLLFANLVPQAAIGIPVGLYVSRIRKYKWIVFLGAVIRALGYGLMIRLRGSENPLAEVYTVQIIQGLGSGIMESLLVVPVQVAVPHAELAQVTGLFTLVRFSGSALGSAVAGAIYNNRFVKELSHYLGSDASQSTIQTLYQSISASALPPWGSPERIAATLAYSQTMKYICIASMAGSGPILLLAFFLPNLTRNRCNYLTAAFMALIMNRASEVPIRPAGK
ncbi:hypothetical protein ACHAPJ_008950 [Fusarium lateritium]